MSHDMFRRSLGIQLQILKALCVHYLASDMKSSTNVLMSEFLKNDMTGKVLISIRLPYRDDEEYRFKSFKVRITNYNLQSSQTYQNS
jgi:hypothetical protein